MLAFLLVELAFDYVLRSDFRYTRLLGPYLALYYLALMGMIGYAFMACVLRHLDSGGRFILSAFVPNLKVLMLDPSEAHPFGEYVRPEDGETVRVFQRSRYESHTQTRHVSLLAPICGDTTDRRQSTAPRSPAGGRPLRATP